MRVVLAASCLLLLTITGTIADTQSAFIPKAKVIAKNAETGVQYETIKYANYCPRAFYLNVRSDEVEERIRNKRKRC